MTRRKPLQPPVPPLSPLPPPTARMPLLWRWVILLIVCAYIGLTAGHLYVTPILPPNQGSFINAPDEAAHLGYVQILAQEQRLPTQADRGRTYEWHQPPLYYLFGALFYPQGAHAIRWLSLVLGLLSLGLIFRAARRLFPDDPVLAVFALGTAALLPMRQAIMASIGNDALTELLFSLTLLLTIYAFHGGFTLRRAAGLGVCLAAALLTKATGLLLVPVILLASILLRREGESRTTLLKGAALLFVLTALCTMGWYARNIRLYHEFTPARAFLREFEGTSKARDWIGQPLTGDLWTGALMPGPTMTRIGYLGLVANWSFRSFWAAYTPPPLASQGIPRFLPPSGYLFYALFVLIAFVGLVRLHFRRNTDFTRLQRHVLWLLFLTLFLVAAAFFGFTWTFFQAQGRYLYPAVLPLSLLAGLGYRAAFPPRYRDLATGVTLALFFLLALAFLLKGVVPAYT